MERERNVEYKTKNKSHDDDDIYDEVLEIISYSLTMRFYT